jgi:excisionase family DNA binding protein
MSQDFDDSLTLTSIEAAKHLRTSPENVKRLVQAGVLPHLYVGKRLRIPRQRLERWVEAQTLPVDGA